jgi:hypothetical protein
MRPRLPSSGPWPTSKLPRLAPPFTCKKRVDRIKNGGAEPRVAEGRARRRRAEKRSAFRRRASSVNNKGRRVCPMTGFDPSRSCDTRTAVLESGHSVTRAKGGYVAACSMTVRLTLGGQRPRRGRRDIVENLVDDVAEQPHQNRPNVGDLRLAGRIARGCQLHDLTT